MRKRKEKIRQAKGFKRVTGVGPGESNTELTGMSPQETRRKENEELGGIKKGHELKEYGLV